MPIRHVRSAICIFKGRGGVLSDVARLTRFGGSSKSKYCTNFVINNDIRNQHNADVIPGETAPCTSNGHWADMIQTHTVVSKDHLTPEIGLRLITRDCLLWHENPDHCPFQDPFWAFYWPGGQALTRYLLDNSDMMKGKAVLDVGSGCGASAIAAVMGGAKRVLANDIDPVAIEAIKLNATLNDVTIETSTANLIGQSHTLSDQWDFVFLGDMFYDPDFTSVVSDWLGRLRAKHKSCRVLIGDPGRVYLKGHPLKKGLRKLWEVELPASCIEENRGHSTGYVWEFMKGS